MCLATCNLQLRIRTLTDHNLCGSPSGRRVARRRAGDRASGNPSLVQSGDPLQDHRGGPIGVVKLLRARGGCLGVIRIRAWKAAKCPGELPNERRSRNTRATQGTETSQYLVEKKSTETPLVAASERGPAQTGEKQFSPGLWDLNVGLLRVSGTDWKVRP